MTATASLPQRMRAASAGFTPSLPKARSTNCSTIQNAVQHAAEGAARRLHSFSEGVHAGGLISYGPHFPEVVGAKRTYRDVRYLAACRGLSGHHPVIAEQMKFRVHALVQGQPDQVARTVTVIAVRRRVERIGQFPFLGFVAPLHRGARDDVVRPAGGADRRRP